MYSLKPAALDGYEDSEEWEEREAQINGANTMPKGLIGGIRHKAP